jgi:hypothetical protein
MPQQTLWKSTFTPRILSQVVGRIALGTRRPKRDSTKQTRALAGAAIFVTTPNGTLSCSSKGPCSMCNSTNAL